MAIKFLSQLDASGNVDVNGNLAVEDEIHLTDGGSTVRGKLLLNSSDADNVELRAESLGSTMKFFTVGTEALLLDASQNATFAGDISLADDKKLTFGGAPDFEIYHNSTTNVNHISSLLGRQLSISADTTTFTGNITFGDSHTIGDDGDDNLVIASSASEDIIIDSADDIVLDAAGNDVLFKDAGTHIGTINMSSSNLTIESSVSDKDIIFKGKDGGSTITALTLDMSAGGNASFTGSITAAADITAFSDERLKEDIKPLEGSLEKVQAIEGVSFVKKNDEDKKQNIGFIAQQLKEVLPEVVHENEDGIHSVAYGNITALLVEAVKEQQEIISQLEERITNLENRL